MSGLTIGNAAHVRTWIAAVVSIGAAGDMAAQRSDELSRLFGPATVLLPSVNLARPLSYATVADGGIVVVEYSTRSAYLVSPTGVVEWRFRRDSISNRALRIPYRVVVLPADEVLIFDVGNTRVTRLSRAGKWLGDLVPDMPVEIGSVVALKSGEIAMSGLTQDNRGARQAIHIFTKDMRYVRSFGELAETKDSKVQRAVGAGGLTVGLDGNLIHTRPYPYQLTRYSLNGVVLSQTLVDVAVSKPTEIADHTRRDGREITRFSTEAVRPKPLFQVGPDRYLGGRLSGRGDVIDLISSTGKLVSSMPQPRTWSAIASLDRAHSALWLYGEASERGALFRVPIRSTQ